jgi:hypothetical protein
MTAFIKCSKQKKSVLGLLGAIYMGYLLGCSVTVNHSSLLTLTPTAAETSVRIVNLSTPISNTVTAAPVTTSFTDEIVLTPSATPVAMNSLSTPESTSPAPPVQAEIPSWIWYQDTEANFTIAYPQTWIIKPGYRSGQTIFSSPETNSEVRIDTWPALADNWLDMVQQDRHRYIYSVTPAAIDINATVIGQPAFFHYQPSLAGGDDMAMVLFQDDDLLFNIFYQSAALNDKAEMGIYDEMVNSFFRSTQADAATVLPAGWWTQGSGSIVFQEQVELKETAYQEITGTLTSFDPGILVLTADDGQTYKIGRGGTYFEGENVDMRAFTTGQLIDVVERLFVIVQPLASGQFKAVYTAVEKNNNWQPATYQSFFDLNREPLPTSLAPYFPPNEPLSVWLRGMPTQLLPYLVDNDNGGWANEVATAVDVLALGTITNMAAPQLQVEKLFVRTQPCLTDSIAEICTGWQQQFPPEPPLVITATVSSLLPDERLFLLAQPSNGFIEVQLDEHGVLLDAMGHLLTWADVLPDMRIRATGNLALAGILQAEKVVVLYEDK